MPLDPLVQHALAAGVGGLGGYAAGQLGGGDDEERARRARMYALLGAGLGGGGSLAYNHSPQIQALMAQLMGGAPAAAPAAPAAAPAAPAPAPQLHQYEAKMNPELQAKLTAKAGPGAAPRQRQMDERAQQLMAMGVKPVPGSRYYDPVAAHQAKIDAKVQQLNKIRAKMENRQPIDPSKLTFRSAIQGGKVIGEPRTPVDINLR